MKSIIRAVATTAIIGVSSVANAEPAFEAIVPEGQERVVEEYKFSPAVRAGDFIFLAGVVAGLPADENGEMAPASEENLIASYERAFLRIEEILNEAGASWADVVDMTTYHTDLPEQIDAFFVVKDRYQSEPYPAWTAIDIDRLFPDRGVTEIKVTAYKP